MSLIKAKQSMNNLEEALERLGEALAIKEEENTLVVDATIQRFEFVIELYWKTLNRLLELEGIQTYTPIEMLKASYTVHWLDDETIWLQMLNDRNKTSHIYDAEMTNQIYQNIKSYYPVLSSTYRFLKDRFTAES